MNRPADMRKLIESIDSAQQLDEKGGFIDKALSKVGTASSKERAKNRVKQSDQAKLFDKEGYKAFVKVIKGNWKKATYANTAMWLKKINIPEQAIKSAFTTIASNAKNGDEIMSGYEDGKANRKSSTKADDVDLSSGGAPATPGATDDETKIWAQTAIKKLAGKAGKKMTMFTVGELGRFLIKVNDGDKDKVSNALKTAGFTDTKEILIDWLGRDDKPEYINKVKDLQIAINNLGVTISVDDDGDEKNADDSKNSAHFSKRQIKALFKFITKALKNLDTSADDEENMTNDDGKVSDDLF